MARQSQCHVLQCNDHLGDHVRRRAARFEPSPGKAVEMQTKLDGILRARPDADRPTAVVFGAAGSEHC